MAKKSDDTDNDDANGKDGTNGAAQGPQGASSRKSPLLYVAVAIAIVAAVFLVYSYVPGIGGQALTSKQIFEEVSNSSLNTTQALFIRDLERSENLSNLYVSYIYQSAPDYITQPGNLTVEITSNQTIDSYKLGNYNRTTVSGTTDYANAKGGTLIERNTSSVYYYHTNTTITCSNVSAYSQLSAPSSSLQCYSGDDGLSYIEEAPFTAANVSSLSYLVFNSTMTYSGRRSYAGRACDNFVISNATSSNIASNYTVFDLCVDTQYGILLYLNQTNVANGIPSPFAFSATAVSLNVSGSELVIPQAYLSNVSHSII
jgi:hypothetical protein